MRYVPSPRRRPAPDFSLSTINIIFLLLLFYLVSGTLIQPGELEADVPLTHDLPLERLPRPLLLLTTEGLHLDGAPVARAEAAAQARAALARPPQAQFLNILAERNVPATALLDLVGDIQAAGIEVRLVTLRGGFRSDAAPAGAADP